MNGHFQTRLAMSVIAHMDGKETQLGKTVKVSGKTHTRLLQVAEDESLVDQFVIPPFFIRYTTTTTAHTHYRTGKHHQTESGMITSTDMVLLEFKMMAQVRTMYFLKFLQPPHNLARHMLVQ
jgi:hypothetical protein